MNAMVTLTLFGWIPFVIMLFMLLPSRRAVVTAFVLAWLFLPVARFKVLGFLPDYDKISATCLGTFIATLIFDGHRFSDFRPKLFDLPMALWCLAPLPSSVMSGLGVYEGLSGIMNQTINWGVPYLIGRVYFNSFEGLNELATGVILGAVAYIPLCLYEARLSPQLHRIVYGFQQEYAWGDSKRGSGWRPAVFMQHGLAVATYMTSATLLAAWISITDRRRSLFGLPMILIALALCATSLLCKSTGAAGLMFVGLGALVVSRLTRLTFPALALIAVPFAYIAARTVGGWHAQEIEDLARLVSERAAFSVRFRMNSEDALWYVVQPHLLFGATRFVWAGQYSEINGQRIVPDGLWVIALGRFGLFGLTAFLFMMITPTLVFLRRFSVAQWRHPYVGVAAAWSVCFALYLVDCLSNAMINPVYLLAAGGLAAVPALHHAGAPRPYPPARRAAVPSRGGGPFRPGARPT